MGVIVCPSGLSLEIRGLKGKELKLLQDKVARKTGRTYDNILSTCTVSVVVPGPAYSFDPGPGAPAWDKVLVGDKFFALLAIRAETFGPAYDFDFRCSSCEEKVKWSINLPDGGLEIKKLATEDAEAFKAGKPLEATLGDGKVAKYRLAVGLDERTTSVHKHEDDAVLAMLARRIVAVGDLTEGKEIKKYLDEAGLRDISEIVKAFEAHDCGVKTDIEARCTLCAVVQEISLPLGRSFWMPLK